MIGGGGNIRGAGIGYRTPSLALPFTRGRAVRALLASPAPPITGANLPLDQSDLYRLAMGTAVLTRGIAFRVEQPSHVKELPSERRDASSLWKTSTMVNDIQGKRTFFSLIKMAYAYAVVTPRRKLGGEYGLLLQGGRSHDLEHPF